ncbi:MAG: SdpI family protein [Clostridia bacterium]|nr:SdpI family protein [Clostridia bacterium]
MIKQNKKLLLLTSFVIFLPILMGLLLWNRLPEQVPFHWDVNGQVDNWVGKGVAVFGMPAFLLGMQWICALACSADPRHKNYTPKMIRLVLWICPMIGLVVSTLTYGYALGFGVRVEVVMPLLVGGMFVVVGNLLPKCPQTYTMGIKLPWTLASEENWNKTHRFGGKVWVIGGIITMGTALLGTFWILIGVLAGMVVLPTVYSYLYYRNHERGRE